MTLERMWRRSNSSKNFFLSMVRYVFCIVQHIVFSLSIITHAVSVGFETTTHNGMPSAAGMCAHVFRREANDVHIVCSYIDVAVR